MSKQKKISKETSEGVETPTPPQLMNPSAPSEKENNERPKKGNPNSPFKKDQ